MKVRYANHLIDDTDSVTHVVLRDPPDRREVTVYAEHNLDDGSFAKVGVNWTAMGTVSPAEAREYANAILVAAAEAERIDREARIERRAAEIRAFLADYLVFALKQAKAIGADGRILKNVLKHAREDGEGDPEARAARFVAVHEYNAGRLA